MAVKKEDHRVRYTKMVIKDSLLDLMKERSINKITVTEICKKASINRNTFYSHYANQFDLLTSIEEELYEDVKQVVKSNMNFESTETLPYELCKYIKKKQNICEILFSENGDKKLLERILYISHDYTIKDWKKGSHPFDEELFENWYTFTAYGTIAIIKKWITNGTIESPEEISNFIDKATEAVSKEFY